MLYIHENENTILSEKHRKLNNLCAFIYDQITEILVEDVYSDIRKSKVNNEDKENLLIDELLSNRIHFFDWLNENNLHGELNDSLTKHITMSILSDFVNFIYESLSCAKKGKISVAYALLRKPFTDELLILEQLLNNSKEFIDIFFHDGKSGNYDPSAKRLDKKLIIKNSLLKVNPNQLFSEDLIYELRYDKNSKVGFNGLSNMALHIVTNDNNYKTSDQNLNFIFVNKSDIESYQRNYYYFVPYLLLYSASIIDSIIFKFLPNKFEENLKTIKSFKRLIGIILWGEIAQENKENQTDKNEIIYFESICKECNNKAKFMRLDFEVFFETELFICKNCGNNILTSSESIQPIKDFMNGFLPSTNFQ